jgi:hypothetical protein
MRKSFAPVVAIFLCIIGSHLLATNAYGQEKNTSAKQQSLPPDTSGLHFLANPDTLIANQIIGDKNGRALVVFTGWTIQSKTLIHSSFLHDEQLKKLLQHYQVLVFYVDDRTKSPKDKQTPLGTINLLYQLDHFQAAAQPFYVIYENGKRKCDNGYMSSSKQVVDFLQGCR